MENRVVRLYLMSYKGLLSLTGIIESQFKPMIASVVIGKDSAVKNDYHAEIEGLCDQHEITHFTRDQEIVDGAKYSVAISWRWIINDHSHTLIIFHDSLLPKYRGFSPLVNQLINGETEVGVTALIGKSDYDTGDILFQESATIKYPITIKQAIEEVAILYARLVVRTLKKIVHGELHGTPQVAAHATYSLWRSKQDYQINWSQSSEYVKRFIDAVGFPFDGARTDLNGKPICILDSRVVEDVEIESRQEHIGKVIFMKSGLPVVVCGKGLIQITDGYYLHNNKAILPLYKFRTVFGRLRDA